MKKISQLIIIITFVIGSVFFVKLVLASEYTWDFSTDSDYSFDPSKIAVSSGQAKLKATSSPAWYNDSWAYRKKITIDKTKIPSTLTNFPVLIQRTDLDWKDTGNGGSVARSDGFDLVFTDADGITILNYEIEKYTASTGELVAWVNLPSVSSSVDTEFYVYYGNSAATNQQNVNAVWDSNFKMVQHSNGSEQANDSTINANNATVIGNPFESYSITSVSPHTGSHQGIATDGTYYYTFDTDSITKFNSSWVQTAQLLNANQSIGVNTTNHLSDGDYYNGKLYVPVENYVHPCISSTNNYIVTWNASDLSFDNKIDVSGMGFSSSGLVIDPNAGDNGIIYNVSYCDGTKIWKLDLSTGAYLGAITLSQPILNSQGITMKDGYFYINDDLNDVVWKVAQDGTVLNSVLSYPHVASGSLEGLDYNTNNLLVLIDQGVSDRKVYTFSKLPLTKIGPALDFKKSEVLSIPFTLPDSGTISLWYNPKNYFYNFHSLLDNSVGGNDWEMWVDSTGYVNFRVKDGETAIKYDLGDNVTQVGLNTWFNIVVKWQKGGNKTLLVNGVQRGTNSATWINPGTTTYIGGGNPGNSKDNGYFDEIRISDIVRSNNWLLAEYNNQNSPATFYSVGPQTSPTFDTSNPSIESILPISLTSPLISFSENATKNGGEIKYQLSNDNGLVWYWWNGTTWASTVFGYTESNTAIEINSHISTFSAGASQLLFRGYLHSDGSDLVSIDSLQITLDSTAPTISSLVSTPVATSSLFIWTTNEQSSSQVEYGLTSSYGTTTTETDTSTRVLNHSVTLNNLIPCTTYYYRVISKDIASNTATSSDKAFTTTCEGSSTIQATSSTAINTNLGGNTNLTNNGRVINVNVPDNSTATTSTFTLQINSLSTTNALSIIGYPTGLSQTNLSNIVLDIKALIDTHTALDTFTKPLTITYQYTDQEIAGLDESTLTLYHYHNGVWSELTGCILNTNSNTITCNTTGLSLFALSGDIKTTPVATSNTSSNGSIPLAFLAELNKYNLSQNNQNCTITVNGIAQSCNNPNQNSNNQEVKNFSFTKNLKLGDTNEDVRTLQVFLNTHGYLITDSGAGSIGHETNVFGNLTKQAVIKYQKANNISPTSGYVGPLTRASLNTNSNNQPISQVNTETLNNNNDNHLKLTQDLELGDINEEVRTLQVFLNTHGYLITDSGAGSIGHETNVFGNLTKQAIIKYQKANNISPTSGYVGPLTRASLGR